MTIDQLEKRLRILEDRVTILHNIVKHEKAVRKEILRTLLVNAHIDTTEINNIDKKAK